MGVSAASLKLHLSGGAANADPAASLGGAMSSEVISASALNNLYDDVTGTEATAGQDEYRCVYWVNEDADAGGINDVVVWVSAQPNVSGVATGETLSLGVDLAGKNGVADTIADGTTAPSPAVTFSAGTTKETGTALPDGPYLQNDAIAIWVKRHTPAGQATSAGTDSVLVSEGES